MGSSLVVVAVPDENDRVWKVSSEKVPHLTILYLGEDVTKVQNVEKIIEFIQHAATTMLQRFYLTVDRRGVLGADEADVLFFKKGYDYKAIRDFRAALLQDSNIKTAYDSAQQFEGPWTPHLTLGYPTAPAKELPDSAFGGGIYSVEFNQIQVWTADSTGPSFLLRDFFDDFNALETVPMDVAMSDIRHVGVKGMRWGQRKEKDTAVTVNGKAKMVTPSKAIKLDQTFAQQHTSMKGFIALHNKASDGINADLPKFNDGFTKKYPKEIDQDHVLLNPDHPITREYSKAYSTMALKHLDAAAKSLGTSPTGKYKVTIRSEGHDNYMEFGWEPQIEKVKHAVSADTPKTLVFMAKLDAEGRIISIQPVEMPMPDAMAQTTDLGVEFLEHFGVKGMRWGVRQQAQKVGQTLKRAGAKISAGMKRAGSSLADSAWEGSTYSDAKHEVVHNTVAKTLDEHIGRLQNSPKYRGKNLKTDAELRKSYYQDVAKVTDKAYRDGVKAVYGQNYTGTKSAHFVDDARGRRIEVRDTRTGEKKSEAPFASRADINRRRAEAAAKVAEGVAGRAGSGSSAFRSQKEGVAGRAGSGSSAFRHADIPDVPDLVIPITLDADGQINGVAFVIPSDNSLAQTAERGSALVAALLADDETTLEHIGVKGMHWGVRKDRPAPVAVAPTATSHVPQSARLKTRIQTQGGENHPAHEDAIKVARAQAKLKKSGTSALSNKELQDMQTRLNLERSVEQLMSGKTRIGRGRAFVRKVTGAGQDVNSAVNTSQQSYRLARSARGAAKVATVLG